MRIDKISPNHHSQLLLALSSYDDGSVQDSFCNPCEDTIPRRARLCKGLSELPVKVGDKTYSMALLICEKYVELLIKALNIGFLKEKQIDTFIEKAAIPNIDSSSISCPPLRFWYLECRRSMRKDRQLAVKQLRLIAQTSSEPWVHYQNSFTQYASTFYDIIDIASASQEEFNQLHQTCVDLGLKMIQDSGYLNESQRKSGERIYFRLTEKSTAANLYRRASGAEIELRNWLQYAQRTYESRMSLIVERPIYVKRERFDDYHYITRYDVTILASKVFYHLEKFAQISVQMRSDYFQGLNAYTWVHYHRILSLHQDQMHKREKQDKVELEFRREEFGANKNVTKIT